MNGKQVVGVGLEVQAVHFVMGVMLQRQIILQLHTLNYCLNGIMS
jgi:hypothetical protein